MTHRRQFLRHAAAAAAAPALLTLPSRRAAASGYGRFLSEFVGSFPRGGVAVVKEDLTFVDPDGLEWTAPAGATVDGASIPRALWSIVGSPFTGDYLRASVIHDHYCQTQERDWKLTHLTFWYGCRADQLSNFYANLLYAAVLRFGPRWAPGGALMPSTHSAEVFDPAELEAMQKWIEETNPTLEEIQNYVL